MLPVLLALLQETPATPAQAPGGESLFGGMLIPLVLCMAVFYFFMIAPESKQRKKRKAMLENLQKGSKVVLLSGLHGTIAQVQDDIVTLQVADGVRMRFDRSAVREVLEEKDEKAEKPAVAAKGS